MGNNSSRESRPGSSVGHSRSSSTRNATSPTSSGPVASSHDRSNSGVYSSRNGRGSRHDLSFLGIGGSSEHDPALEPRRETRAEREARRLEKERALRVQERERSIREEGVDGGYLVTLGTYTGPEDFSKPVVRQLQVERRLAPFWKGLNDHSDTWTEYQLVCVVNGLPLPRADEPPPDQPPRSTIPGLDEDLKASSTKIDHLTVPITARSMSASSDRSANLSPSHPAFSLPHSAPLTAPSSSPFFRGRAKTLAALSTSSRNNSQTDMTPQEIQLPKDPYVNGQRVEAFLYKNAAECPICFLYYPPYLNRTRCCDQQICSECFVQIKRPDPHPPEHHDEPNRAPSPNEQPEDNQLVSEPSACPFCVQPEFGVTYDPPPFRRGLAYAIQGQHPLANAASAMSSTSSLNSQGLSSPPHTRRRATSLAATDANVITTDRVRPDWAKKLADARAHALRRAAAATALHNAAYMMGNLQAAESSGFRLGRRRRTMFGGDSPNSSGHGTPRGEDVNALIAHHVSRSRHNEASNDILPGRHSSRRPNRLEDLEELMMMEAIRLSLAAEEERKKKEEKDAAKEAKKEEKKKAKEAKKAEKAARKSGFFPPPSHDHGEPAQASSSATPGKGKAVDRSGDYSGFQPPSEAPSGLTASWSKDDPQRHLEQSRAQIQSQTSTNPSSPSPPESQADQTSRRAVMRSLSNASSSASSFAESYQGSLGRGGFGASGSSFEQSPNVSGLSLGRDEANPSGTPGTEPMLNFRSLAAVMTTEDAKDQNSNGALHIENTAGASTTSSISAKTTPEEAEHEPLGESVATMRPVMASEDEITSTPPIQVVDTPPSDIDAKHVGEVSLVGSLQPETTQ